MSTTTRPEEPAEEYARLMGPILGSVYFRLWNECVWLHWKWEEFETLYGTSGKQILVLNQSANSFFSLVQDTLWESVLLHISRLTDPPTSVGKGKKNNLTLKQLPALVEPTIKPRIESLLDSCARKCEFARDWRMRRIAHSDLALALGDKSAVPLMQASRNAVTEALRSMVAVLNEVELHYRGSTTYYEVSPLGNANCLIRILAAGLQSRERKTWPNGD